MDQTSHQEEVFIRHIPPTVCEKQFREPCEIKPQHFRRPTCVCAATAKWKEMIDKETKEGKRQPPSNDRQEGRLKVLDWKAKDCSRAQINPEHNNWEVRRPSFCVLHRFFRLCRCSLTPYLQCTRSAKIRQKASNRQPTSPHKLESAHATAARNPRDPTGAWTTAVASFSQAPPAAGRRPITGVFPLAKITSSRRSLTESCGYRL